MPRSIIRQYGTFPGEPEDVLSIKLTGSKEMLDQLHAVISQALVQFEAGVPVEKRPCGCSEKKTDAR